MDKKGKGCSSLVFGISNLHCFAFELHISHVQHVSVLELNACLLEVFFLFRLLANEGLYDYVIVVVPKLKFCMPI